MKPSQCITAVFISLGTLCQAHMNQPQQAFGVQQPGQMAHPAGAYGAAPQMGHPPPQMGQPQLGHVPQAGNMLRDKAQIQDREHIQEHLQEILGKYFELNVLALLTTLYILIQKCSNLHKTESTKTTSPFMMLSIKIY